MATCRAEPLATGNISCRLAAVQKALRSVALQTPMNSHSELELDTLRNIQPTHGSKTLLYHKLANIINAALEHPLARP